ncbi:glucosamine-6-phosphate deaminase [Ornithinibacillus bavariensis]|uniref:Glucosamine-6-phosphate deaminase n=1 Tax=Ornithinibacillus bavariensis TaxID=545502 RepID=A0A920C6C1_9BACI|nr:glucosamine-6-phosphate deaminase [Ornithinibacillus bavariensis]GIO26443.1 glucosamine-6-phosphate deaminase 1 [Ornithinibacillus bavariensis]HAM81665.1 glucosamine-6-phosphate deaminase [Ornithinibacillus sp.]
MNIISVKDYQEMSKKASEIVVKTVKELEKPVLGLATGSTPEGLYQCLIENNKDKQVSFQNVTTFNLDEYVGLAANDPNSYRYFMDEKLFNHIDISKENTFVPNGVAAKLEEECASYEELIRSHGSIDLQILGIGLNGHIGFNEPGTPFTSRTHIVELDESTRSANARFFASMDEVPTQAITTGIETIMESKKIVLLVSGENKADAIARLVNGEVSEDFPASILQKHQDVTIIADEAALSKLN